MKGVIFFWDLHFQELIKTHGRWENGWEVGLRFIRSKEIFRMRLIEEMDTVRTKSKDGIPSSQSSLLSLSGDQKKIKKDKGKSTG